MVSAERVARRFLADVIADPKEILVKFREDIADFLRREEFVKDQLPKLKRFVEMIAAGTSNVREPGESQQLSEELNKGNSGRYDLKHQVLDGNWFHYGRNNARKLFWSILQQYALPPQLQKSIEAANKFWSKERTGVRIKAHRGTYDEDIEVFTAYLKIHAELLKQLANAEAAITKGKLHSDPEQAAKTKFTAGAFTVVNTGGFTDETMHKSVEIATAAEKAMTSHGLGKVCYGDVLISKRLQNKAGVAAFYLPSSDEMFIRADLPADSDHVRHVCHELTHRLVHKFLGMKRSAIPTLYAKILNKSEVPVAAGDYPPRGEVIVWNDKEFVVTGWDMRRQTVKVSPPQQLNSYYALPLTVVHKLQGKEPRPESKPEMSFVTHYAKKGGPEENFCEMTSFYVLGKLPEAQVPMLEEILFG